MKSNNKFLIIIFFIVFLCLPLAGCYDSTEIDEEVYALAIGVDKGVSNMIRVTVQYATYKEGGGSQGSGGGGGDSSGGENKADSGEVDGTIVSTVEAPSLLEGINFFNLSSNRQISLFHAKMLVISEEYAREGVMSYIESLARYREIRESMRVVVCRGTAEEFIKESSDFIGTNMSKGMELGFYQSRNTGYFPDIFFHDFYSALLSPYGQPVAIYAGVNRFDQLAEPGGNGPALRTETDIKPGQIPRKGGSKSELFGTAVFDGDKMVGALFKDETRFYLMAVGKLHWGVFSLEDKRNPGYVYIIEIANSRKPEIRVRFAEGIPVIDLKLKLEADIVSIQSRIDYESLSLIGELEKSAEEYFREGIKKTIEKTQNELNSDIFFFGKKASGSFRTIQELENYNWLKHYREAEVNVDVDVKLRRTGFLFETAPVRSASSAKN
jgi:spore germination protein KC